VAAPTELPSEIPVYIPVEHGTNGLPLAGQPIAPAMIELLSSESGLKLVVRPLPWRRAQAMAEKGEGLLYGAVPTPERLRVFRFTEPIDSVNQWLVSTSNAPIVFRQWDDVRGKVISILSGAKYSAEFERQRGRLFTVEQNSPVMQTRMDMLRAGRVDAVMVASYLDAVQLEAKLNCMFPGTAKLVVAGKPIDVEPLMIAVPRTQPLERSFTVLNHAVERLAGSERLQRVRSLVAANSVCR
jgi:ABC-type amino acid transport substrate-binding protein